MKRGLRFFAALAAARLSKTAIRMLGRTGSHTPGKFARRVDPDFLAKLDKPKHVICLTGTNGKTTAANFISDILTRAGIDHVQNTYGSNLQEGNIVALISKANWRGKTTVDWGVFEVDEIASKTVFPALQPDIIAITNLFRDSYRRNAHADYIADILAAAIPPDALLVLNADDLISSRLAPQNKRAYFSLPQLDEEEEERTALINDMSLCPACSVPLVYDFQRYHHIGHAHCPVCGLTNASPDYTASDVTDADFAVEEARVTPPIRYKRLGGRITDLYNQLTAIAVLREAGLSADVIRQAFESIQVTESRFSERWFGRKRLITMMGKDSNPVANTRTMAVIGGLKDAGPTAVLIINQVVDSELHTENVAWIYDCNLEYLNRPFIKYVGCGSPRHFDFAQRFELAGIPPERILGNSDEEALAASLDVSEIDTVVVVFGTKKKDTVARVVDSLADRLRRSVNGTAGTDVLP